MVECAAKLDAQVGALALALEEQQADLEHKAQHLASLVCIVLYHITFEKRWKSNGWYLSQGAASSPAWTLTQNHTFGRLLQKAPTPAVQC